MRSSIQVGFWLCINDVLSVLLNIFLSERKRIHSVYRDEFVCVTALPPYWTFVLFSSSLHDDCSDTHAWDFVPFCSHVSHSGTHTINVISIGIESSIHMYVYLDDCDSKDWTNCANVCIKMSRLTSTTPCLQPIAICMHRSLIFAGITLWSSLVCDCKTKNQFRQVH